MNDSMMVEIEVNPGVWTSFMMMMEEHKAMCTDPECKLTVSNIIDSMMRESLIKMAHRKDIGAVRVIINPLRQILANVEISNLYGSGYYELGLKFKEGDEGFDNINLILDIQDIYKIRDAIKDMKE